MWYAYANGSWSPIESLHRATLFGDGVFETIHIYQHKPLFIESHIARLAQALSILDLVPALSMEDIVARTAEIANLYPYARLKIVVYRKGEGAYTPLTAEAAVVIGVFPYSAGGDFPLFPPAIMGIYPFPVNAFVPWSRFKTLSALRYVRASAYAQAQGYADAVLLSVEGYLSETSRANLFFWDGQTLYTPPLSTGCVEGVLRRVIQRLAKESGIPTQEILISPDALPSMKAIFSTNVMQGIQPITAILHEGRLLYRASEDLGPVRYLAQGLSKLLGSAMTD
ncbi:MAG: aminotransferase class IV [Bacteroidia bacterium]|nr:aminotransferase class IV [Bacteroidia bacterium]